MTSTAHRAHPGTRARRTRGAVVALLSAAVTVGALAAVAPAAAASEPGRPLAWGPNAMGQTGTGTVSSKASPAFVDTTEVGSSRVDLQACKLEYSIVSPK